MQINPNITTNAAGLFSKISDGYVQGAAQEDPSTRFKRQQGTLSASETLPMFAGCAIKELLTASVLGNSIARATSNAEIQGFCVSNGALAGKTWPQSNVPMHFKGDGVNFYRLGSGVAVPLAIDPSLASLIGGAINPNVSWDLNAQRMVPYSAATATVSITSLTAAFTDTGNPATCFETITVVAAAATTVAGVGDAVNISGATNTGTGGNAVVNGTFIVTEFTDNQHFKFIIPAATTAAIGTIGGTIVANQGVGALNVKILDIQIGNSKIAIYDPIAQTLNWTDTGSCALVQL